MRTASDLIAIESLGNTQARTPIAKPGASTLSFDADPTEAFMSGGIPAIHSLFETAP